MRKRSFVVISNNCFAKVWGVRIQHRAIRRFTIDSEVLSYCHREGCDIKCRLIADLVRH